MISPLFVGGLGNRLYQLAAAANFANRTKTTLAWCDLNIDQKQKYYSLLNCFKVEDLMENGGHPTKYKLNEVFDLPTKEPLDHVYLIKDITSPIPISLEKQIDLLYTSGYFMFADIVEDVLSQGLFPKWRPEFQPPTIPLTKYIIHFRTYYQHDNFDPAYLRNQRIDKAMASISLPDGEGWTVFSNNSEKIPESISKSVKYIYGTEIDVYETLRHASGDDVKLLIMSCSTLSGWMAFLGKHDRVFCPLEYIDAHGIKSLSPKWVLY